MTPGRSVSVQQVGSAIRAAIGPIGSTPTGPLAIPEPLGRRLAVLLASDMRGHFDRSASPDGVPWAPIRPRPQGGDKPLLNTGKLRNTITGQPEPDGASAGTNAIQANLMNSGGTIRPTRARLLAIPITREAIRAGGARQFPRQLVLIRSTKGNVLLVEPPAKAKGNKPKRRKMTDAERSLAERFDAGSGLIVHYVLVPSVTIKARPFAGFTEAAIDDALQMVNDHFFGQEAA